MKKYYYSTLIKKTGLLFTLFLLTVTSYSKTLIVTSISSSGAGSLRTNIVNASDGDTIRFNPALIANGSATIELNGEIIFNKNLVIKGLYNATDTLYISGKNKYRIFKIDFLSKTKRNIVLDSMVLINGSAGSKDGGAIYIRNADTLFIHNSRISNSTSDNQGGGLFFDGYNASSILRMNNSILENNTALEGGGFYIESYSPGSLTKYYCEVTITHSTLQNNIATDEGGAISSYSAAKAYINIIDSKIIGNEAPTGAGIYTKCYLHSSFVTLKNSSLSDNIGNALYANSQDSSTVTATNCTINNNSKGGLHTYSTQTNIMDVSNSTFSSNTYNSKGAGISTTSGFTSTYLNITNSTFTNNTSDNRGGAIYSAASSDTSHMHINNSTFVNNNAQYGGGAISSSGKDYNFNLGSSIIAFNKSDFGVQQISLNGSSTLPINSKGDNIFSYTQAGSISSDQSNVKTTDLKLSPLANYGGITETMPPGMGSVAIDKGKATDMTAAQNRALVGRRDVGAAEYNCVVNANKIVLACPASYTWIDGITYTTSTNTPQFTVFSSTKGICDTTYTLNLTFNNVIKTVTKVNWATLQANETNAMYQWLDCENSNKPIPGATNQSYVPIINGTYAVRVTKNHCTTTSDCIVFNTVGIEDVEFKEKVYTLYPNPTTSLVSISNFTSNINTISIYDLSGKLLSYYIPENALIDLSSYQSGIYLIKIETKKDIYTYRVVKE